MEINNKALHNRERLDDAVAHRNYAKQTRRATSHHQQPRQRGVNGTSLLNKLVNLANDKFVTKSAGNTPCGSPLQQMSPRQSSSPVELSPRPLAKSDICLICKESTPHDITKSCGDLNSIRTLRRVSSPTHEKRLIAMQQPQPQQQQQMKQEQRILVPKCSRKVLRPTSSRHILAHLDCNRHQNDLDSDSTTTRTTSEETEEVSSSDEEEEDSFGGGGSATFCIDDSQLQFLKEKLEAYRDDDYTTMSGEEDGDDNRPAVTIEFKNATPSNRNRKRSEIILSPSARILKAGFTAYKRHPNGIVNFVRTDVYVANWRFCYVCSSASSQTRYVRQLALTDVLENYAGFKECQIFRIVKFCAACFDRYNEKIVKEPDRPFRVRMTPYATNLFCPL